MQTIRIAIDGPGGAGKSTIAKAVARKAGIDYIDTGAMYRAIGYKALKTGVDIEDETALQRLLDTTKIDFSNETLYLDGEPLDQEIRTQEISAMASKVSAKQAVREKLVFLQREMGRSKSVIMDGRDIGTNVFTDAEFKFYLTAAPEERAKRRYDELILKGEKADYDTVLAEIMKRDHDDMTRELNPLKKADDAIEIDTTDMTIDEVIDTVVNTIVK